MNLITGIRDLDREILNKIPDEELLKMCLINKRFYYDVCNDDFLQRRYSAIEKYKNERWKKFLSKFVYYITKMKNEFDFIYTEG